MSDYSNPKFFYAKYLGQAKLSVIMVATYQALHDKPFLSIPWFKMVGCIAGVAIVLDVLFHLIGLVDR